jgi:hypothetical protein
MTVSPQDRSCRQSRHVEPVRHAFPRGDMSFPKESPKGKNCHKLIRAQLHLCSIWIKFGLDIMGFAGSRPRFAKCYIFRTLR